MIAPHGAGLRNQVPSGDGRDMTQVFVERSSYEYTSLRKQLFELLDACGGGAIRAGAKVLVKPNLLSQATPDQAVLTHYTFVRVACEYVLEKGGRPTVADSPSIGSFERIVKEGGIADALAGLPVELKPFRESVPFDIGPPFGAIEIAADVAAADFIINLAKLKTHAQMLLTLGVKNLFGCVVGFRKPEWHMRAGIDREMFARLLVQIGARIRPQVTIVDGILAMEGEGPGKSGTPRDLGYIIAGADPFAVDTVICRMLNVRPDTLPTLGQAARLGLVPAEIEIVGDPPSIRDFRLPRQSSLIYGPRLLQGFARRHLLPRPRCDDGTCRLCGKCWEICPAHAVAKQGERLTFDYDRCIRCYCCIEVCPHAAVHAVETLPGRLIRKVIKRFI
ncbi:MAG: DUF362 domain-containing protein [Smithellaceae bacterium]|nr:DUF362 domain-containing protein [Smithellaceae bacterium]